MPNKSKIVGEIEVKVREMCEKGYNPTHIGKQVGLAKDTIKSWANKNGIVLSNRLSSKIIDLEPKIIELLKNGVSRKQIQTQLHVHYDQVTEISLRHGIKIKDQLEAAIDKTISLEEAQKRLPPDGSQVIGYDQQKNKYIIKALDGFIYHKSSAKIKQGDPRGKSGTPLTIENVKEQLVKLGYEYVEGFTIKRKPLKAKHLKCGQIRENRLENFYFQDCPTCSNTGTSKAELELLEWVRTFYPSAHKYKFQERITKPKEIDIYIPELKLGIEYCGLYFHSEKIENAGESKHYKKMLAANEIGIRLITIFENEWLNKRDQIKGFLISIFKRNERIVYARDCKVVELDCDVANAFLNETHIQGKTTNNGIFYGLVYEGELLAVVNGGMHPQKAQKSDTLYLNRLAFKFNTTVVGGSSRLFSYLVKYAKSNNYNKIISWSDNRWSEGNVYSTLGFTFDSQKLKGRGLRDGSIWPEFYYCFMGSIYTKKGVKKLQLDTTMLPKVYDCGKKRWIFNIP
jgi:hypothetical protein